MWTVVDRMVRLVDLISFLHSLEWITFVMKSSRKRKSYYSLFKNVSKLQLFSFKKFVLVHGMTYSHFTILAFSFLFYSYYHYIFLLHKGVSMWIKKYREVHTKFWDTSKSIAFHLVMHYLPLKELYKLWYILMPKKETLVLLESHWRLIFFYIL